MATAEGATLTREGERIIIEAEASAKEARGTFTLKLWEAGGARAVVLGGVTFP